MNIKNIILYIVCFCFIACKKNKNEVIESETVLHYKNLGYEYLFTIDKNDNDSILPVFINKTSKGDYKLIVKEIKNKAEANNALIWKNNIIEKWSINPSNFNAINKSDYFLMEDNDLVIINNTFYERDNSNFSAKKSKNAFIYNTTMYLEDTLIINDATKQYRYPESNPKNINNFVRKSKYNQSVYENCYNANLYKKNGFTYLSYTKTKYLNDYTWSAELNILTEKNGKEISNVNIESNYLVFLGGGCDNQYMGGLDYFPIFTNNNLPKYIFYRHLSTSYRSNYGSCSIFDENQNPQVAPISLKFEDIDQRYNFLTYNNEIFVNSCNIFSSYNNCKLYKVKDKTIEKVSINLSNIKGIFGNEFGIIVAVQNQNFGLDFVRIR